ncbi:hypothetical protein [Desulfocurvus vexinensis]|uniref:hypothetical protein n=1 Tax=Desulfocurvus vexinensis TaxID=399548 RepID=UPI00146FB754|nr:hypothetical protein [Desulfocurvus vexinensis]
MLEQLAGLEYPGLPTSRLNDDHFRSNEMATLTPHSPWSMMYQNHILLGKGCATGAGYRLP